MRYEIWVTVRNLVNRFDHRWNQKLRTDEVDDMRQIVKEDLV